MNEFSAFVFICFIIWVYVNIGLTLATLSGVHMIDFHNLFHSWCYNIVALLSLGVGDTE